MKSLCAQPLRANFVLHTSVTTQRSGPSCPSGGLAPARSPEVRWYAVYTDDVPDDATLEAWLRDDDEVSRSDRLERLRLVVEEYGPGAYRMFPGGPISAWAFEEARRAYVLGLDLSCVMMCQACVEHSLHGFFKMAGRDDLDKASFARLLREAHTAGYLDESEFQLFDRLRRQRNPYAHPRSLTDETSLIQRAVSSDTPLDDLVTDDARQAVTALLRLTRRAPFTTLPREHS